MQVNIAINNVSWRRSFYILLAWMVIALFLVLPHSSGYIAVAQTFPEFWVEDITELDSQGRSLPISFWGFSSGEQNETFAGPFDADRQQELDPINLIFYGPQADPNDVANALAASGWNLQPLPINHLPGELCGRVDRFAFSNPIPGSDGINSAQHAWRLADDAVGVVDAGDGCKDQFHVRLWSLGNIEIDGINFEVSLGQAHHECAQFGGIHTVAECAAVHIVVEWDMHDSVLNDLTNTGRVAEHWQADLNNTTNENQWREAANNPISWDGIATVIKLQTPSPSIEISKGPDQAIVNGSEATFTITVENTGNVPLTDVEVTDALTPDCDNLIGDMGVNHSFIYVCTALNVNSGFTNSATVTGIGLVGQIVSDTDTATVEIIGSLNAVRSGFNTNILPGNDDGSTGQVPIGFNVNFFGTQYNSLFINNNGNLTFDFPHFTYTPFGLQGTERIIIAPFFADVDTRVGNVLTYGNGTVGTRPAFGVTWPDVGCFLINTHVLNTFQVLLIDRSDIGPGDFDIEFNYDKIQWETGEASGGNADCLFGSSARVGYSNGVNTSFELPGSGIPGTFLDSNTETGLIHNSRNSLLNGRYIFHVRNGVAPTGGAISGTVSFNPPLQGATVQVCGETGFCNLTTTNTIGQYSVSGLEEGNYTITAYPPAGFNLLPGMIGPVFLPAGLSLTNQDLHLAGPTPPPADTTITSRGTNSEGLPVIYWGEPLTLTTQSCTGGTANYQLIQDGAVLRSGGMAEGPPGTYTAIIAPLFPDHGDATVVIHINCPDTTTEDTQFDIYIDPSGTVVDQNGNPIAGATVTLFRSDSSSGPFEVVPDGSGIMHVANRNNPDTTDSSGHFGWDVIAGFYIVRAEAENCSSTESDVLTIPPPVTDLMLVLECVLPVTPPTAIAGGPYTADQGSPITFDGTGSFDIDGEIVLYEWDLDNDGEYDDAIGATIPSAFSSPGAFTIRLRVTDDSGATDTDIAEVTVNEVMPQEPVIINDSLSFTGPTASYDPTPIEGYAGGVYTVTGTWKNISNPTSFFDVFAEVAILQGNGCPCAVLNADGGAGGVGAKVSLAESLAPGETITSSFNIGLSQRARFDFFVNVLGVPGQ